MKLPSPVSCTGVQSYLTTASRHKRSVGLVVWMDGIPSVLVISEVPQRVRVDSLDVLRLPSAWLPSRSFL